MGKQFDGLSEAHQRFIADQHMFFVGTAARDGRVSLSPKGMGGLHVAGPNRIVWRNLTGSGNETAGHLRLVNRMTLMWCAFEGRPEIMRCYGSARTVTPDDADWQALDAHFPPDVGARQIFDMSVNLVQTSCGYAVPLFDYRGERDVLAHWARDKGQAGIATYWDERNGRTIDGFETGTGKHGGPA